MQDSTNICSPSDLYSGFKLVEHYNQVDKFCYLYIDGTLEHVVHV